jgi:hypothetical protein
MQRREFLANSAAMSSAAAIWAALRTAGAVAGPLQPADDPLFACVCDLVIPATDTPGAREVGVAGFMTLALAKGLAGSKPSDRADLETLLNATSSGTSFLLLSANRQREVLVGVDQSAYAERGSLWARMKSLILMGYYTSEPGATQELYYQLVPGRYDPDVLEKPGDRASSNDWTGQRF